MSKAGDDREDLSKRVYRNIEPLQKKSERLFPFCPDCLEELEDLYDSSYDSSSGCDCKCGNWRNYGYGDEVRFIRFDTEEERAAKKEAKRLARQEITEKRERTLLKRLKNKYEPTNKQIVGE